MVIKKKEDMPISTEAEKILIKCSSLCDIKNLTVKEKDILLKVVKGTARLKSNNLFLGRKKPVREEPGVKFFTFSLPRKLTCPGGTGICRQYCYQKAPEKRHTQNGRESAVVYFRKLNWFLSVQDGFVGRMVDEIINKRPKQNERVIIRIHPSGDFYSEEYLKKWLRIALITKFFGKQYEFVAYTKSFSILDNVLSDQEGLKEIYDYACEYYHKHTEEIVDYVGNRDNLQLSDFNIHIIASYMDDTADDAKDIAKKWSLPVYYATENNEPGLEDCEGKSCANCMKCYQFPMKDVTTKLR